MKRILLHIWVHGSGHPIVSHNKHPFKTGSNNTNIMMTRVMQWSLLTYRTFRKAKNHILWGFKPLKMVKKRSLIQRLTNF